MSSNQASYIGYCCRLVRENPETQDDHSTPVQPYGTIVKLSGLPLDGTDSRHLHRKLPGLLLKVTNVPTEYALVTTHSLIPNSSDLNLWKFSDEFLGTFLAKKTLDKYVSGVVSCCGKESGFIVSGPTTALEHRGKKCNLGLNFTILFLNEKFKQHYCAHYANQPNPPHLDISQCKADIDLICRYLHLPRAEECEATGISTEAALNSSADSNGFEMIAGVSSNGKVSLSALELSVIDDPKSSPQKAPNESSVLRSNMGLARDIITFQRVKTVQCKGSNYLGVGMPLVYISTDGQESSESKLIGMLTGDGHALILSSLFHLLQGNPAACLSLLVYTEMWRLWTYKWSHLLLSYLQNHPGQPKLILEILVILLERKCKEEEHFLSVSRRDDPDTRLGFLKFLEVLFHHFDGQSKEAITQMTKEVCSIADVAVDNFLHEIGGLCESLSTIIECCCDYKDGGSPNIMPLIEHCVICANEMLNFQHDQDVVENVLSTEEFETALNNLQSNFPQSSVILSNLVAFYKKVHAPCRRKLAITTEELCCCRVELTSCKKENENLQAKNSELKKQCEMSNKTCQSWKTRYNEAFDGRKKALNTLADSEKRHREIEGKHMELKAEIEDLKQLLRSEKELKQKIEADNEKLREDMRRLVEDKKKIDEDKGILKDDNVKLKEENKTLKSQNDVLKYQANQQRESGHAMQRTMSDLSGMVHQIQRYLSEGQKSSTSPDQSVARKHNTQSDSSVFIGASKTTSAVTSCTNPADDQQDLNSTGPTQLAQTTTDPPKFPPDHDQDD